MENPDQPLLRHLAGELARALSDQIPRGARVALINFPNHPNAGDSALWMGERAALERLGTRLFYQASWASYRRDDLARALRPGDLILLHAGGNIGDLYPDGQARTRLRVLEDFPSHRTIQLPQSIWFTDENNLAPLKERVEAHRDFTLLVRERPSLERALRYFRAPAVLCPDMAFELGALPRAAAPELPILWLARADKESAGHRAPRAAADVRVADWLGPVDPEPPVERVWRAAARINLPLHAAAKRGGTTRLQRRVLAGTFAPMARHWTARGCRILARGRVVVTDRLHGHILALLQGIPHVALDNSYGKIRAMVDTWTGGARGARWARDADEALELARSLVERAGT